MIYTHLDLLYVVSVDGIFMLNFGQIYLLFVKFGTILVYGGVEGRRNMLS